MNGIFGWVECNAEPCQLLGDPFADTDRIFADAGGEHESVEALQRGSKHSRIEAGAVDEVIDSKRRMRILAGLQFPHVVADTGKALQTRIGIEGILFRPNRHSPVKKWKQDRARVRLSLP